MADYQRAVKALSLIVAANDRQQLLLASTDLDVLIRTFILPPMLGDASTTLPQQLEDSKKLLQLLCSAYANVTDLVTGPLHDDFTKDSMLHLTSVLLGSVCVMLGEDPDSSTGATGPKRLSKAQVVSSTGLITALTAACAVFAKQLMKHRANHDMVYSVAATTLHTVTALMLQWPGKRVLGRIFPPLLLPATRLALVMAQLPNPADEATQSFGSQQQATDFPSWSQLDLEHLLFAGNLVDALQQDILHLDQSDFLQYVSAAQHILESQDVRELCVALFATQVKRFHIDQQSSPDALALPAGVRRAGARSSDPEKSSVQPPVAASHDKVLAILGCKNTRMLHSNLVEVHRINCTAHAVQQLLTYRMRLPDRLRQIDQRPPLPLPTWEAVLLLYVQLELLAPNRETVMVAQESIYHMCALPSTEVASWKGEFITAGRGLSAAVAEAVLLLVPSAVQKAKEAASVSGDQAPEILESYAFSLWSVLAITVDPSIADVLQKHPGSAAAALEMAARGVSIDTWIKNRMLNKYLGTIGKVLNACLPIMQDQHSRADINPEQQSQQTKPLLQLALSCLKSLRSILQTPNLAMDDMLQAVVCATKCVLLAVACKPFSASIELSEGHAAAVVADLQHTPHTAAASAPPIGFTAINDSKSALLSLVTAVRGLNILGCCFGKLLDTCKASDLLPGSKVTTNLQVNLLACCDCFEWVRFQLWTVQSPTLDNSTRITLVNMCKAIRGILPSQSQPDLAPDVIGVLRQCQQLGRVDAMAAELGPKLQQLGAAVCSALPIPSCCNNHQCVNTAHYTEQQLVGGKGCLCGGCRTARYCSATCQKKHWSKHKAVCNAIKQARLHSSASGSAQASV